MFYFIEKTTYYAWRQLCPYPCIPGCDFSRLLRRASCRTYHALLMGCFLPYNMNFCFSALRDNRIELVRASWHELSISVSDVSLSDEGQYTCSLFTMPVKTSKAFLTVLGKYKELSIKKQMLNFSGAGKLW